MTSSVHQDVNFCWLLNTFLSPVSTSCTEPAALATPHLPSQAVVLANHSLLQWVQEWSEQSQSELFYEVNIQALKRSSPSAVGVLSWDHTSLNLLAIIFHGHMEGPCLWMTSLRKAKIRSEERKSLTNSIELLNPVMPDSTFHPWTSSFQKKFILLTDASIMWASVSCTDRILTNRREALAVTKSGLHEGMDPGRLVIATSSPVFSLIIIW